MVLLLDSMAFHIKLRRLIKRVKRGLKLIMNVLYNVFIITQDKVVVQDHDGRSREERDL